MESIRPILERAAELAPLDLVIRQNLEVLERRDDRAQTVAAWRVDDAVDPHEAGQAIRSA